MRQLYSPRGYTEGQGRSLTENGINMALPGRGMGGGVTVGQSDAVSQIFEIFFNGVQKLQTVNL